MPSACIVKFPPIAAVCSAFDRQAAILLLLALALLPAQATADVIDMLNSVRAEACGSASAAAAPLRHEPRLDDAAQRISDGASLESATDDANYPARMSASIRVRSVQAQDGFRQTLEQRFCDVVGDAQLTEVGYFLHGAETWLVFGTPFAPSGSVDADELNRRVLQLINEARLHGAKCGGESFAATTILEANETLGIAAQSHAEDMASHNFLGHEGSSGSMPGGRTRDAGYAWSVVGENVAAGQSTAEEVVRTWLDSPLHCANLMSPDYSNTGIAHAINYSSDKGIYWVQLFAKPR